MIHEKGKKAALVLNPATPLCMISHVLESLDMVLLMSVNPGFGGQAYIESVTQKIRDLRQMVGKDFDIEVDGGIGPNNLAKVLEAGANVIVAGSAVFGQRDIRAAALEMQRIGEEYESHYHC